MSWVFLFLFSLELVNYKEIKKKEAGPRIEPKALLIKSHLLARGIDRGYEDVKEAATHKERGYDGFNFYYLYANTENLNWES